jgi:hypothetical protein
MTETQNLVINPTELRFRFELRKTIPVTLSLTNPAGSNRVAFKVRWRNSGGEIQRGHLRGIFGLDCCSGTNCSINF